MNPEFSQAHIVTKRRFLWLGLGMVALLGLLWAIPKPESDGRAFTGGDIEITSIDTPLSIAADAYMVFHSAAISRVVEMEARARVLPEAGDATIPVIIKGVDANYPLYGTLKVKEQHGDRLLFSNHRKKTYGAVVDQEVLDTLKLKPGQFFKIGGTTFKIQGILVNEPDRRAIEQPRVLVNMRALEKTGLFGADRAITYRYRAKLPENGDLAAWLQGLREAFPDSPWKIRTWQDHQ